MPPRSIQNSVFRGQIRDQCDRWRGMHPSGASVIRFDAVPWPAQFKLRTLGAIMHVSAVQAPSAG
eukprot:6121641-Alexandrium_andersonii.AAC.1